MDDEPDRVYFNELLKRRRSSTDVSDPIATEKEAIVPMSASYTQSV